MQMACSVWCVTAWGTYTCKGVYVLLCPSASQPGLMDSPTWFYTCIPVSEEAFTDALCNGFL